MSINPQPVSIIITTKNESKNIARLLNSIKNQTYSKFEIIVVDNHSTDNTKQIAKKFTSKVFDWGPERSAQRNYGVKKSNGKYLLFLDADMELTSTVLEDCVRIMESDKSVGGVIIPEESTATNIWEKAKRFERSFYHLSKNSQITAARFCTRKVFKEVGGFDEAITGPEDWDFSESIESRGYKIHLAKEKLYHYENIPNLSFLAKKKYYYALKSHRYLKIQSLSLLGPKTIYFLRRDFYTNWRQIIRQPTLILIMLIVLTVELVSGAIGFLVGRMKNK